MSEIDEISAERRRLRAEYRQMYEALSEILFRHDPIGINFETNTDEYEPEVDTILPRLTEAHTPAELRRVIHEEFTCWFGKDIAGPESKYEEIAQEAWATLQRYIA